MGLDYYRSLRILALADVIRDDSSPQYSLRRVMRWYSKAFHTPLHQVEELPLHDVLMHYYESHYEELSEETGNQQRLHDELLDLSMTDEERASKKAEADHMEFEDYSFGIDVERRELEKKKKAFTKEEKKSGINTQEQGKTGIISGPLPNIKMTFMDESQLEEMANSDGLDGFDDLVGLK